MKKGKGKQQLTKGVRLCPARTMANLYRSKQLKQRQEREAMTLVKDIVFDPQRKNKNRQLQDKHQNEDRVSSEVPLEHQNLQTIFVVPDEGKAWVLKTVGDAWRTFKHRVKDKYFEKYENDEERWNHRPDYIPEDVFADLLAYWDLEATKARIEELQSQENTSDDSQSIHDIIGHMGQPNGNRLTLYGREVKPSDLKPSGDGKLAYKIPGECVESIKQTLEQEIQQRLNAEKDLIEQEMEYKFDQKLQAKEAAMHTMISQFLAQLGQVNPSLNINTEIVTSLFPLAQSPGDIPNTSNEQSKKGSSSMEIYDDEQQIMLFFSFVT